MFNKILLGLFVVTALSNKQVIGAHDEDYGLADLFKEEKSKVTYPINGGFNGGFKEDFYTSPSYQEYHLLKLDFEGIKPPFPQSQLSEAWSVVLAHPLIGYKKLS